jgi:hypothetical protein
LRQQAFANRKAGKMLPLEDEHRAARFPQQSCCDRAGGTRTDDRYVDDVSRWKGIQSFLKRLSKVK